MARHIYRLPNQPPCHTKRTTTAITYYISPPQTTHNRYCRHPPIQSRTRTTHNTTQNPGTHKHQRQRPSGRRCQKGRRRLERHPRQPKTHRYNRPTSRTTAILGHVHNNTTHTSHTTGHRPTLRNTTPILVDHPGRRNAMHAHLHPPLQTTQAKSPHVNTQKPPLHLTIQTPHPQCQSPWSSHRQRRHRSPFTHTQLPQRRHNNPQIHLRPTI